MVVKKSFFFLKQIDPDVIEKKYGLDIAFNLSVRTIPENKTSILQDRKKAQFSFLDESKKDHECVVTMMNFLQGDHLPETTLVHCFWCRHPFPYRPIGCPIKYISPRISKTYHSELSKTKYTLRENITLKQFHDLSQKLQNEEYYGDKVELSLQDYYIVDGVFCSFNCNLAFILEHKNVPMYFYSEQLLLKMYYDVFGEKALPLEPAPSWRLLQSYGGHQTIEEFRKNFYKVEYHQLDNVIFPNTKSVGFLFEKQTRI